MRYITRWTEYLLSALAIFFVSFGMVYFLESHYIFESRMYSIMATVGITLAIAYIYYAVIFIGLSKKHVIAIKRLELNNILYELLHKTSITEDESELYKLILKSAINAIHNGQMGSILNIQNPEEVSYMAVEGFDMEILGQVDFKLEDTYLYKETGGRMDRTVIISDSMEFNRRNSVDENLELLLQAGTERARSTICTPIIVYNEVVGMINIDSNKNNAFTYEDIKTIEVFSNEISKMIIYTKMKKENLYLSRHDSMTGILNRGYFYECHKNIYEDPSIKQYVFITMDINNLKEVNDTYGHHAGDCLINFFTKVISDYIDETVLFGRFGGDEFNIIMPNANKEDAEEVVRLATSHFKANSIKEYKEKIYVSFSYGIVEYPFDETSYEELIKLGDERMYKHKRLVKGNESLGGLLNENGETRINGSTGKS